MKLHRTSAFLRNIIEINPIKCCFQVETEIDIQLVSLYSEFCFTKHLFHQSSMTSTLEQLPLFFSMYKIIWVPD